METISTVVWMALASWIMVATAIIVSRYLIPRRHFAQFAPPQLAAFLEMAERFLAEGRQIEAMVVAKKLAKLVPNDSRVLVLLARVHAVRGNLAKASAILSRVLATDPACEPAARLRDSMGAYRIARDERRGKIVSVLMMTGLLWLIPFVLVSVVIILLQYFLQ